MDPGGFFLPFLSLYRMSALRFEVNIPCLLSSLPAVFPSLDFGHRKGGVLKIDLTKKFFHLGRIWSAGLLFQPKIIIASGKRGRSSHLFGETR